MKTFSVDVKKQFQSLLDEADAIVVGAGSGLSTAAGFTYSGARFERYFRDFIERFGIRDRGYLREGCYADVTVFDEAALKNAVPDQECSFGIEAVFVNGEALLKDGRILPNAKCGRAIRV